MKNLSFLALLTFAASAPVALAAQTRTANLYSCTADALEVGFTTTSFAGNPTFGVKGDTWGGELSQPDVQNTAAGFQVTAHVQSLADAFVNYTLVVPHVNLAQDQNEARFQGLLIKSVSGGLIAGPQPGPVQHNEFIQLDCKAQGVFF
jgi:hypothetical protein